MDNIERVITNMYNEFNHINRRVISKNKIDKVSFAYFKRLFLNTIIPQRNHNLIHMTRILAIIWKKCLLAQEIISYLLYIYWVGGDIYNYNCFMI